MLDALLTVLTVLLYLLPVFALFIGLGLLADYLEKRRH